MPTFTEDSLAIQALVAQTAHTMDAHDWDAYVALYTDDGIVDYPWRNFVLTPREFCDQQAAPVLTAYAATQHQVTTFAIAVDGDEAVSRCCVHSAHAGAPAHVGLAKDEWEAEAVRRGPRIVIGATWIDELRRTPAGWRITRRVAEIVWVDGDHPLGHPEESEYSRSRVPK